MDDVADKARRAADTAGRAVQDVLDDPRLRERLPGGSLPLLGAGLVTSAVLVPLLPFVGGGLELPWAGLMLVASLMLGARELGATGRKPPALVEPVVQWASHPAFLPMFTALTVTQAFLSLGFGVAPLLWVLAALVVGSVQWRVFRASPAAQQVLPRRPGEARLKRWVFAGVAACAVGMLLPWSSRLGAPVGGLFLQRERTVTVDSDFGREIEDTHTWQRDPFLGGAARHSVSGQSRLGATGVVLSLLALGVLASVRRARQALPPVVVPVLAGLVTVWALTGLSSRLGPWLFLLGILAVDVAVSREWLGHRGVPRPPGPPPEPREPPASA